MATIRIRRWSLDLVSPVRVRHAPSQGSQHPAASAAPVHRDPTPTPGAFEPPVDLFRAIARGGRPLE